MGFWNLWRREIGPKTAFVSDYEKGFKKRIPNIRAIEHLDFVVLDTETTGLNPAEDFIVSFGAVKVRGYAIQVESALEYYLDTPKKGREAIKVHEILYHYETYPIRDFGRDVLQYLGNSIVVGHHIGFDVAMLEKTFKPFGLSRLQNPILDTLNLAVRLEKGPHYDIRGAKPNEYSLDSICMRYQIPLDDRHTAPGDAFLTAQLLLKLLKLAESKGIRDFEALMR
ncbi:3'-5' exonuclease [Pararhodonellum marinum]|uniref:3'-5' exonuclease n=1 Tax=Pararhodonellum marinum TaxID=2755358 RepID=UPI001890AD84|nr:3'-5' exonuclease [Pararhodonellum marinum]